MIDLNPKDNDTSCVLDIMRAVAAQAVCVGHALNFFGIDWLKPHFYMQNVGVLVFFLLSGLLIAVTLVNRTNRSESYGLAEYTIDRVARIHSGLIPSLLVVAAIDGFMISTGRGDPQTAISVKLFVANVFCLEGYSGIFPGVFRWPVFGTAAPLWTLAIEFHIYLCIGAAFFLMRRPTRRNIFPLLLVFLFFVQTPLVFLFGGIAQNPPVGTGLFALWLCGFALAFVLDQRFFKMPLWLCATIAVTSTLAYFYQTTATHEYDPTLYPLLIVGFASIVACASKVRLTKDTKLPRLAGWFAGYSFTLYLVQYTIIGAIWRLFPHGIFVMFVAIIVANLTAAVLAHFTEARHRVLAAWLKRHLLPQRPVVAAGLADAAPDTAAI